MGNLRERILEAALERFTRFGFHRVTMDELSSGMGVSKKTVYKHFPAKERLLDAVMDQIMRRVDKRVRSIMEADRGYLDKLRTMLEFISAQLALMSKPLTRDMQRFAPDKWKRIEKFRHDRILTHLGGLIEAGRADGVFRSDIDRDLLITCWLTTIEGVVNPEALTRLPVTAQEAFTAIHTMYFEGLLTDKGRMLLKKD